jgi:hypothetical protein
VNLTVRDGLAQALRKLKISLNKEQGQPEDYILKAPASSPPSTTTAMKDILL